MMIIRAASLDDAAGIRGIRNAAVRDTLAVWTEREQTPEQAVAWLEPAVTRGTALVAVERHPPGTGTGDGIPPHDDRIIGFAVAVPWRAYEGYARTVEDSVYLSPTAQGRGVGGRLLAALIDASRRAGDRTMIAAIEAGNDISIHLHERHGFVVVGTIPAAGEKHGRLLDLTLMSRALRVPPPMPDASSYFR
ncbi:N-acyltransferase YncA [Actinomyces denticolens]|uniref:GNAT family N-acetyltransferase n=1 Tax=Actinomyces TaxID=1654 RepID=UPI000981747F|nr:MULTISPECIES: GNAT family N-acetyltransferase [Actinomyces]SUU05010.1 N-acyltransferase YncA [Actinomyces denticolens]